MDNLPNLQQPTGFQPKSPSKFKVFWSKNKSLIISISIMGVLSIAMTWYLLASGNTPIASTQPVQGNNNQIFVITPSPKNEVSATVPPPAPIVTPVDPTATWSAFVSTGYSYSIKYPPNWTAQTITQEDPKILEYVVFNPAATQAGTLSITLSYGTRTYQQALALDPQTGKTVQVASVSATQKDSKDSNGFKAVNVIVPFGSNTIIINAKEAYLSIFTQMLAALKLTK